MATKAATTDVDIKAQRGREETLAGCRCSDRHDVQCISSRRNALSNVTLSVTANWPVVCG